MSKDTWGDEGPPPGSTFDSMPPDEPGEAGSARPEGTQRYEYVGPLGSGGMADVWRVRDRELNRTVAMKVLRKQKGASDRSLARFREEAQVAAQLQHPGIVPIHDIGRLPDNRIFFTMKEVAGRTLEALIREAHRAGPRTVERQLRRLISDFLRVCETVAYAHHRGVVHRDLKPANIMFGDFGEVLVLDWGLARLMGGEQAGDEIVTDRSTTDDDAMRTRAGIVSGTPAYMAPEQARAERDRIGPASDVFALGASLYELLTDVPPYFGPDVNELLARIAAEEPITPPSMLTMATIPEELERVALRALKHDPGERCSASELADALADWLDGAKKRERALELASQARSELVRAADAEVSAATVRSKAAAMLAPVSATAAEAEKWPGWDLEDQARRAETDAGRIRTGAIQQLQTALSYDPDCGEVHDLLAAEYQRQHAALEAEGKREQAASLEPWLRTHDRGRFAAYLKGDGALTLITDPEGAEVDLYRFETVRRRLVPVFERSLGKTPIRATPIAMGSYLLKIRTEGRVEVSYPVLIGRQEHWDGVAPGDQEPTPIALPTPAELGPGEIYVPAGWFWCGGELEQLTDPVPFRRVWADAFVIREHPVTNQEYVDFLNALMEQGRGDEAAQYAPRKVGAKVGSSVYPRSGLTFSLGLDAEGHEWRPRMPVVLVDYAMAEAFAAHVAKPDRPWRLPFELEWEKAARGADGRTFPWGEEFDASWARTKNSWTTDAGPVDVDEHPADVSVFGARHLAGNVVCWTQDPRPGGCDIENSRIVLRSAPASTRRIRGGSWGHNAWWCRADVRKMNSVSIPSDSIGVRLVRSIKKM